jgi:hypothetical protein
MYNEEGVFMFINELKDNEIFVFGSNEAGRHGKGAAKQAMKWGAKYGQGEGLQGRTYGIPTKNKNIETLSLNKISKYISNFIVFAQTNPQYTFLVTKIGCGLAGYNEKDIAPLFYNSINVKNIIFPPSFIKILKSYI